MHVKVEKGIENIFVEKSTEKRHVAALNNVFFRDGMLDDYEDNYIPKNDIAVLQVDNDDVGGMILQKKQN